MTTYYEHNGRTVDFPTVEFEPPPNSEAVALRLALVRLQQDNYALQAALSRTTEERDAWRDSYMKLTTRELP